MIFSSPPSSAGILTIPTQILFTQHRAFQISNVPHAIEDVDEQWEFHLPLFHLCIRLGPSIWSTRGFFFSMWMALSDFCAQDCLFWFLMADLCSTSASCSVPEDPHTACPVLQPFSKFMSHAVLSDRKFRKFKQFKKCCSLAQTPLNPLNHSTGASNSLLYIISA
jgi:hypothetical protein